MHGHLHDLAVLIPEMDSDFPLGWEAKRVAASAGRVAEKYFCPCPDFPVVHSVTLSLDRFILIRKKFPPKKRNLRIDLLPVKS